MLYTYDVHPFGTYLYEDQVSVRPLPFLPEPLFRPLSV